MKKSLLFLSLVFSCALHAQLEVTSDGKVKIASSQTTSYSTLLVGNNQFVGNTAKIGVSGSTTATGGKSNIGIMGITNANSNITADKNYGVLGIVSQLNMNHGRNYGLCGMIGFSGDHYGGAGIYATNYTYYFANPTNIQGDYAGYFQGPVKVTGNITAPNMFIPTDSRLSENVVSLKDRGGESNTLDNLIRKFPLTYVI